MKEERQKQSGSGPLVDNRLLLLAEDICGSAEPHEVDCGEFCKEAFEQSPLPDIGDFKVLRGTSSNAIVLIAYTERPLVIFPIKGIVDIIVAHDANNEKDKGYVCLIRAQDERDLCFSYHDSKNKEKHRIYSIKTKTSTKLRITTEKVK